MPYELMIHGEDDERIYTAPVAARLARMSRELLEFCAEENLVRPRRMASGEPGFSRSDIRELARIRRLQEDLGLDMAAVEVVLHMRRRMLAMLDEMADLENRMIVREQMMRREIRRLRRSAASEADWR